MLNLARARHAVLVSVFAFLGACTALSQSPPPASPPDIPGTWYFAVSGDSRDCGDLIMPKIAQAIAADTASPARFYWHLGDFRRLYGPDCDVVKRDPRYTNWDCGKRPEGDLAADTMSQYLAMAWDDFIERQIHPFAPTPVFLGIGNHELAAGRTSDDFRRKFQPWLTSAPIHLQRVKEASDHFYSTEGDTYYHFVMDGVDFIYLDNADDGKSFSAAQLNWLETVLKRDETASPPVRTIVVGMHEALPFSKQRIHAMDATCQGLCSGQRVYDLLYRAQKLDDRGVPGRRVYVFASHSHTFVEDAFAQQAEHAGQVLPGWIVGTAGAEQYRTAKEPIEYGYVLGAIHPDGTLVVKFHAVTRDSPPVATDPGAGPLTDFCFTGNRVDPGNSAYTKSCACGEAKP
ncbi:MAG TPA: hypothetical protein VF173_26365 [Thermoanaerobaculia bacterium]|nr:hypothetical protein [Thermoanaerobaculia bacterium]